MRLYNSGSRTRELFKSDTVNMYACGPTVYHYAHIGNLRTYLFEDFLRRTFEINGKTVKHVMNITDVGHLTSDADDGEDKMVKGAKREGKTVWQIAEFYTNAFLDDIDKLNIKRPTIMCKATDHIEQQIEMIQQLEQGGYTYEVNGNVYFDTSKFDRYADLANLSFDSMQARVESDNAKRQPQDFVLWFTNSKFGDQDMQWDSPWGRGYPGWHIECSAMASHYLGNKIDVHCGGIDHLSVHHTNELAQSECALGVQPWVQFWMHGEFLVTTEKMSKSKNNFLTVSTLEESGYNALDYRYMTLLTHYRKPLQFSWDALTSAKHARERLHKKVQGLHHAGALVGDVKLSELNESYVTRFMSAVNDDLNMPLAIAVLHDCVKDHDVSENERYILVEWMDRVLGLNLTLSQVIPPKIIELADQRLKAREQEDYARSDMLRDEILSLGYTILDTKEGYIFK